MKRHILLAFGFIFAALASMAAVGDRFKYGDIWYEVLDEDAKTCQTAAAANFANLKIRIIKEPYNTQIEIIDEISGQVMTNNTGSYNQWISGNILEIPEKAKDNSNQEYTVVRIGEFSFAPGSNVQEKIIIPNTVTEIGKGAFYNSQNTKAIDLGSGLKSIGESAFIRAGFTSVEIPGSVEKLENNVFAFSRLENVTIQEGVKEIDPKAFEGVVNLKRLEIPGTVSKIEAGTFQNNTNLEELILHDGITGIGESAFANCGIKNLTIPGSVERIEDKAFYMNTNLGSIIFNEGLKYIGKSAFEGDRSLGNNDFYLTFPDSLLKIDDNAFHDCSSTHHIIFGKNLKCVGKNAFDNANVTDNHFYLPPTLTDIDDLAFDMVNSNSSGGLTDIFYPNLYPKDIACRGFGYVDEDDSHTFNTHYWIYDTVCLHVPVGMASYYRTLEGWKHFKCIIDDLIPENADAPHNSPEDPLSYIIDYIYLIPGEKRNLNDLIGEPRGVMLWNPIDRENEPDDFEIVSLDEDGNLEAKSYGNVIALATRTGNTTFDGQTEKEVPNSLAGAVIIFVCPTITVVYDKDNLTENDGTPFRMNKAPRRVEEISENELSAPDLKTQNTTYTHYVVSGSFPKVQVTPAPYMEIVKLERASLDGDENYIESEGYAAGLKEVSDKLYDPTENVAYAGAVLPRDPITENRMLVVTMDIGDNVMTGNQEIEIDDKISVVVSGRTLSIIGADEDAEVLVSDIKGHIVYNGTGKVISLEPGIYIVKVEDVAFKAIVR